MGVLTAPVEADDIRVHIRGHMPQPTSSTEGHGIGVIALNLSGVDCAPGFFHAGCKRDLSDPCCRAFIFYRDNTDTEVHVTDPVAGTGCGGATDIEVDINIVDSGPNQLVSVSAYRAGSPATPFSTVSSTISPRVKSRSVTHRHPARVDRSPQIFCGPLGPRKPPCIRHHIMYRFVRGYSRLYTKLHGVARLL